LRKLVFQKKLKIGMENSKWDIQILDEMPSPVNESRMLEYVPFIIGSGRLSDAGNSPSSAPRITVSESWWNSLPEELRSVWSKRYNAVPVRKVPASKTSIMNTSIFKEILKDYEEYFSLERFKQEFDIVSLTVPKEDRVNLAALCRRAVKFNTMPKRWNEDLTQKFIQQLENVLEPFRKGTGAFVKTTMKSGNYTRKPTPCFTVQDVFANLFFSDAVLKLLESDQPASLIFRKFHRGMDQNSEYRVFVFDGAIRAISQQHFEEPLKITESKIKDVLSRVEEWFTKWIENHSDLHESVLDVAVLPSDVVLLEINPGGAWNESTSALYTWKEIVKAPVPYFRIYGSIVPEEIAPSAQEESNSSTSEQVDAVEEKKSEEEKSDATATQEKEDPAATSESPASPVAEGNAAAETAVSESKTEIESTENTTSDAHLPENPDSSTSQNQPAPAEEPQHAKGSSEGEEIKLTKIAEETPTVQQEEPDHTSAET
jgi:hypothetical protein